ncbi:MAG: helix-turn-helix transcriptional regulator [Eubacteriales bacterium]|nr:helix-turn-helix transcriptional regulator [Eubacteriales bacterium]
MDFSILKIKEIDCVLKYTAEEMSFTTQNRHNHIIGIHLSGSAVHYLKNQKFTISENCIYFLNQKDDYKVKVLEKGVAFSVHFTTYEPIDTESFCIKTSKANEIVRLLNIIEKEYLSKDNNLGLMSDLYNLCSELNKIYQKSYFPKDKRMTNAETYINTHFAENNCLAEAAEQSSLSRRRFNDLFKKCFGMTPNRYLTSLKIDYAKNLIGTDYFSISQIAEMCGFSDVYYFCKVFKSETGTTPAKYKKYDAAQN